MKKKLGILLSATVAIATIMGAGSAVQAAPAGPSAATMTPTIDVVQVRDGGRRWVHRGNRNYYGGDRRYSGRDHYRGRHYGHRRGSYGPALGLGFGLGLGTGYYFGGYPYYSQPYYAPAPRVYASRGSDWKRACAQRYRSFDWRSGTYLGYDGRRHLCRL